MNQTIPTTISRRRAVHVLGGLATLVAMGLPLTGCGTNGEAKSYTVTMVDMTFDPPEISVPAGSTVTWQNQSGFVHTVTTDPTKLQDGSLVSTPDGTVFDSGTIAKGATWSHTFDTVGEVNYCCAPHELAGMVGRIIVT